VAQVLKDQQRIEVTMKYVTLGCLLLVCLASAANPFKPSARGFVMPEAGSDQYLVSFWDGEYADPMLGADRLAPDLALAGYPGDGTGWYLVQFSGPVYQDQVKGLERTGAQFLGFHSRCLAFVKANSAVLERVRALGFVRWAGVYQPGYKFWSGALAETGFGRVSVTLLYPENLDQAVAELEQLGCTVVRTGESEVMKVVEVDCPKELLPAIARFPWVMSIQEKHEPRPENSNCQWVVQTWSQNQRRIWDKGLYGSDEVLGYTDTGLDVTHNAFKDPAVPLSDTGEYPTHRKVVIFRHYPLAGGVGDPDGHGTHVAGTIAGNDSVNGGTSLHDGHSKGARIAHLSPIPDPPGDDFTVPLNMITNNLRNPELRPHTISNSWWTLTMGQYTNAAATFDLFSWKNKDVQTIKSCGNQYQSGRYRITEPGNSKSIISAAALLNGTSANQLASYSSRGPAPDNRVKPDISVPGDGIYSAQRGSPSGYVSMSGTSMSAPCVNGNVGLLRSYLRKGYYPSGSANPADTWGYVSSAILKGMVLVSADPMPSWVVPSESIGWGRLDLDSVLFFTDSVPDARRLLLYDDTTGLATGQYVELQFRVNALAPLRCAVVWTDTAAAAGANPCLINNLNCLLTAPSAKFYKGCLYTAGQSTENPSGAYDNLNPLEMFRVNVPDTGLWTLRVEAQNVVTARQPYAVVVTGGIVPVAQERRDAAVRSIVAPVGLVDSGTVVAPRAVVANLGTDPESVDVWLAIGSQYADTQTVALGAGSSDTVDFTDWAADSIGTFEVRCSTALAGDQNPANDLAVDTCQVVPLSGIREGGVPTRFELCGVRPTPFSGKTLVRFALPKPSHVSLGIFSAAGIRVAVLADADLGAGLHTRVWNGLDQAGRKVSRGVYYCRLSAGGFRDITKIVKLD